MNTLTFEERINYSWMDGEEVSFDSADVLMHSLTNILTVRLHPMDGKSAVGDPLGDYELNLSGQDAERLAVLVLISAGVPATLMGPIEALVKLGRPRP